MPPTTDLTVTFPSTAERELDQDEEWCRVGIDGEERKICFHDYHEIFDVPGLYERIFHEHLECRSPAEVVGLLGRQLEADGVDPQELSVLDVGAGNGIVGEELRALGVSGLVGVDILREAAAATARDRPGRLRRLRRLRPDGADGRRAPPPRRGDAQLPDDRRGAGLRRHAARGVPGGLRHGRRRRLDRVQHQGRLHRRRGTRPASAGSSPTWSAPARSRSATASGTATGCRCTASRWTTWRSWVASGGMAVASAA